jgi:peroxiredoxin
VAGDIGRSEKLGPLTGQPAPGFTLPSSQGRSVSLADFAERKLILVFLRHFA